MIVFIVIVVLVIGNCEVHGITGHTRKTGVLENFEFHIEIQTNEIAGPATRRCSKDCPIFIEIDQVVNLTCKQNGKHGIQWIDICGDIGHYSNNALSLLITPDDEDINRNLTCQTQSNDLVPNYITVTMVVQRARKIKPSRREVKYLNSDFNWRDTMKCDAVTLYHSQTLPDTNALNENQFNTPSCPKMVIELQEIRNGTEIDCIKYNPINHYNTRSSFYTVERKKEKFIFYLGGEMEENASGTQSDTNSSKTNPTAIVGGVLGTIILILLAVLLTIWYRTLRGRARDDRSAQVIYAEIDAPLTAPPPPPPRNLVTYAQIMGTLMPKEPSQTTDKTNSDVKSPVTGDQHSDVKCQVNDPISDVICQVKDDPHSDVKCQTKDKMSCTLTYVANDQLSNVKSQGKDDPYVLLHPL